MIAVMHETLNCNSRVVIFSHDVCMKNIIQKCKCRILFRAGGQDKNSFTRVVPRKQTYLFGLTFSLVEKSVRVNHLSFVR